MEEENSKGFFQRIFGAIVKSVVDVELEADLYRADGSTGRRDVGELEFKRFKAGNTQFEVEIKGRAKLAIGEEAVVLIHGVEVCKLLIKQYESKLKLFSEKGDEVPPIKLGDKAEVMMNGEVVLEGIFRHDD